MWMLIWYQISGKKPCALQEAAFKNNRAFSGGKYPENALKNVCSISEYLQN
jgi:hypothetical protein